MKTKILSQINSETAKLLAQKLNAEFVNTKNYTTNEEELLICYGFWGELTTPENCIILNRPEAVKLNSDKNESLIAMRTMGVRVPEDAGEINFPLVGRTKRHKKGNGFWLVHNNAEMYRAMSEGAKNFYEYIPIKDEYRIHVFNNKVIDIRKKVENLAFEGRIDYIIRSLNRGWLFAERNKNHQIPEETLKMCCQAVEAVGLHFGAVDLVYSEKGEWVVLEVNSSPGISLENTKKAYINEINKIIEENTMPKEKTYTEKQINQALNKCLRYTKKYGKPYTLVNELVNELKKQSKN